METRKYVPEAWMARFARLEERFAALEAEAEKRMDALAGSTLKELDGLIGRVRSGEISKDVENLRQRAEKTGGEVLKKLEVLPEKALDRMGVATQSQLAELAGQVKSISRKLDRLSKRAKKAAATRASRPNGGDRPQA